MPGRVRLDAAGAEFYLPLAVVKNERETLNPPHREREQPRTCKCWVTETGRL